MKVERPSRVAPLQDTVASCQDGSHDPSRYVSYPTTATFITTLPEDRGRLDGGVLVQPSPTAFPMMCAEALSTNPRPVASASMTVGRVRAGHRQSR